MRIYSMVQKKQNKLNVHIKWPLPVDSWRIMFKENYYAQEHLNHVLIKVLISTIDIFIVGHYTHYETNTNNSHKFLRFRCIDASNTDA